MSTIIRSALVALALFAGASAAAAQPSYNDSTTHRHYQNSPDSVRAFWDAQQRNGQ